VRLDRFVPLPAYEAPAAGLGLAIAGLLLLVAATRALWVHGGGLPMSPYPPPRFVSRDVYRYLRHPMYAGAVLACAGLSLALGSPAGLWIVSPLLLAATVAWVLGHEGEATWRRFGSTMRDPILWLPPADARPPLGWNRLSVFALVFLPWLVLYEAVEFLGTPPDALIAWQAWDLAIPVIPWTEVVYLAAYPFVLAVPFVAATRADLRWFMAHGWIAMALIIPIYLLVPIVAPARAVEGAGLLQTIMRWERAYDAPVTAFPAFHAVWMFLAAVVYTRRWPSAAALWWGTAAAVSASCVTVGMHATLDIAAAIVAFVLIVRAGRIWGNVREGAERLANSWREVTLGPIRLINHGVYAAAGGCAGVVLAVTLAGPASLWPMLGLATVAVVGAGAWAQLVEGSPQLLRPYGYFGSVAGVVLVAVVIGWLGHDVWLAGAAFAVGAAFAQAIGRARCLVQGCCHGRECPAWLGIRYAHPRSRVTRLSSLGGVPLHPTPVYSAAWMVVVGAVLLRLWLLGAGLQFIVGLYFVLTGLGRFVEEHYRGEPQTLVWHGFRLYQWLAIAFVGGGAATMAVGWTPAPGSFSPAASAVGPIVAFGIAAYVAFGVDVPGRQARFSRLV
jgi:hypothetical protein